MFATNGFTFTKKNTDLECTKCRQQSVHSLLTFEEIGFNNSDRNYNLNH